MRSVRSLVVELLDLVARNEAISDQIDEFYEDGLEEDAARMEEDLEAIQRRMDDVEGELEEYGDVDELMEGEGGRISTTDIEGSVSVEENLIQNYGYWLGWEAGKSAGPYAAQEDILANMRSALETARFAQAGWREGRVPTDEEILDAAKDLWEERQELKQRYLGK